MAVSVAISRPAKVIPPIMSYASPTVDFTEWEVHRFHRFPQIWCSRIQGDRKPGRIRPKDEPLVAKARGAEVEHQGSSQTGSAKVVDRLRELESPSDGSAFTSTMMEPKQIRSDGCVNESTSPTRFSASRRAQRGDFFASVAGIPSLFCGIPRLGLPRFGLPRFGFFRICGICESVVPFSMAARRASRSATRRFSSGSIRKTADALSQSRLSMAG